MAISSENLEQQLANLLEAEEARATTPSAPPPRHARSFSDPSKILFFSRENGTNLSKKTVLISGGTAGIGRALVTTFATRGFNVAAFSSTDEKVQRTQQEFKTYPNVLIKKVDVSDNAALSLFVKEVEEKFGTIQILINNAAITGPFLPNEEVSAAEREMTFKVNLHGLTNLTEIVQKRIRATGITNSVIVNISSSTSTGIPGAGSYSASKAGVNAFSASTAAEDASSSHLVFAFDPGPVDTDMQTKIRLADPKKLPFATKAIQLKREEKLGNPLEVAKQVYFLVANPKLFLTENGTVLPHAAVQMKIVYKTAIVEKALDIMRDSYPSVTRKLGRAISYSKA